MCDLLFGQNLECVLQDLVTENADLQSRLHRERTEAQQQLKEKVSYYKNPFLLLFLTILLIPDCRRNSYNPVRGKR